MALKLVPITQQSPHSPCPALGLTVSSQSGGLLHSRVLPQQTLDL